MSSPETTAGTSGTPNPAPPTTDAPNMGAVISSSLTLGVVVGVFGIVFGVSAIDAGGTLGQAMVMSLGVFTGASQLSATAVLAAGGTATAALVGAVLLASRNTIYGLTMSRHLTDMPWWQRLIAAQLTIDESTAMALTQTDPRARRTAFWVTGISVYVFWSLGTLIGALAGNAIDPALLGLDAAIPAGFVGMVAHYYRENDTRLVGILGGVICAVTLPLLPAGVPLLAASAAVLVGLKAGAS